MGQEKSSAALREELLARLRSARVQTDELFRIVRPGALYDRPIPERHRIVFYLGHLEAFDWNLLGRQALGSTSFHPEFDRLFAFGIDPVGGGLPTDQPADWPREAEIARYQARVRQTLDAHLEKISLTHPVPPPLRHGLALDVAIEHRLMHAETLAYMLHQLPHERKFPLPTPPLPPASPAANHIVPIPAGLATLGRPRVEHDDFGWDNEFEEHAVHVPGFAIDDSSVTNGQFLEFITAGGYEDRNLWTEAGWAWKSKRDIRHPIFWARRAEAWRYRTTFDEVPLPLDWPAYVSHAEAAAFVRWKGKTLPTEAQFHRAAFGTPSGFERKYPWGNQPPDSHFGNFDFQSWDPAPVGAHPAGQSAFGVQDLVGNGWEWTSSLFEPFPGFQPFPFYPGYSADFFDGKHYVIKGGSPRTSARMLRRPFRNWFQPHYPFVYAKFRGVVNES